MILALLTHGTWGKVLLESAELIVGTMIDTVCFPLLPDDSFQEYVKTIQCFIEEKGQKEILLMVDIKGGSTFNAAGLLSRKYEMKAVSGLNMEMLILADELRNRCSVEELPHLLIKETREKTVDMESVLGKGVAYGRD